MVKSVFFGLILFCILSIWSLITPLFEFPDEQAHLESVEFLATHGRMPAGLEWDMTPEMAQTQKYLGVYRDKFGNNLVTYHPEYRVEYTSSYIGKYEEEIHNLKGDRSTYVSQEAARYPRLYYDYIGIWYRAVQSSDIFVRTFAMRLGNVVLAGITAVVIYAMGMTLFASRKRAMLLTVLVMLQPMYSFLSAGVNSDNLHNLLFTLSIYCGLLIVKQGASPRLLLGAGLVALLDMFTKPQGYLVLPVLLLAVLLRIIRNRHWGLLTVLIGLGILAGITIASPLNPYRSWILTENIKGASLLEFLRFSVNKLITQNIVWYWGVFKWLGVVLPPIYWQVANRVAVAGVVGLLFYAWKAWKHKKLVVPPLITTYLLLVAIFYAAAIYYFDWQYTKTVGYSIGVQARYLFPTISAHMAILMVGILSLGWTKKLTVWLERGLLIFIVWMQLGGIWRLITSYYDVSSFQVFVTQVSQYKPWFAKGDWWYLWICGYIISIFYLVWTTFTVRDEIGVDEKTNSPTKSAHPLSRSHSQRKSR